MNFFSSRDSKTTTSSHNIGPLRSVSRMIYQEINKMCLPNINIWNVPGSAAVVLPRIVEVWTPGWLAHTHFARDPCCDESAVSTQTGSIRLVIKVTVVTKPFFFDCAGNGGDQRPHEQCVTVTNLDDPYLFVGISCNISYGNMAKLLHPKVLQGLLVTFPAVLPLRGCVALQKSKGEDQ